MSELRRLVRYAAVGASNTAVTLACFTLLTGAGVGAAVAAGVGFAAGAGNGWWWNGRWTFAGAPRGFLGRYVAVQGAGAGLSAVGVAALRHGLGRLGAEAAILPCVTLLSYTGVRRFVFVDDPSAAASLVAPA